MDHPADNAETHQGERLRVEVARDHLEKVSRSSEKTALLEMYWNALDAEATTVKIEFYENSMGGLDRILIIDDGHGISIERARTSFGQLGGSWKKESRTSVNGARILHGEEGKGRYTAFALGESVTWHSTYSDKGSLFDIEVRGRYDEMDHFAIIGPDEQSNADTGTEVEISNIHSDTSDPRTESVKNSLTAQLAPYLTKYPNVDLFFDGDRIDPKRIQDRTETLQIDPIVSPDSGKSFDAEIRVVEWSEPIKRRLYLCDAAGFAFDDVPSRIHAKDFTFTAYLQTDYIRQLNQNDTLALAGMDEKLQDAIDQAKSKLKQYFAKRRRERRKKTVERWRQEEIYPYKEEASSSTDKAERAAFNRVALDVEEHLEGFEDESLQSKQFTFRLLRHALQSNPEDLRLVINEVLDLPADDLEDLAMLLDETSLSAIISASKRVADRLDFIQGLENLIFHPQTSRQLKERSQLQKILEKGTWLFGEEYNLTTSDQTLENVLRRHRALLDHPDIEELDPVKIPQGKSRAIPDLVLGQQAIRNHADELEYLVVEIKRPSKKIDLKAQTQIQRYAQAVANDKRFHGVNVRWEFWVLSADLHDDVRGIRNEENEILRVNSDHTPHKAPVRAMEWSEVLDEARSRHQVFKERLQYSPSNKTALDFLQRQMSEDLLPEQIEETVEHAGV